MRGQEDSGIPQGRRWFGESVEVMTGTTARLGHFSSVEALLLRRRCEEGILLSSSRIDFFPQVSVMKGQNRPVSLGCWQDSD